MLKGKLTFVSSVLFVFSACTHGTNAPAAHECDLLLTGATIVNPATQKAYFADLVVKDAKIASVDLSPKPHQCTKTLDLRGSWLIPGLTDMHVHSWGNPSPTTEDNDETLWTEAVTHLVLKAGVTALLDLGNAENVILPLRDRLKKDEFPLHAELFAAGPVFIEANMFRKRRPGMGPRVVKNAADARKQVRELALKHPDVIKIIYDHANFPVGMHRSTMKAIVEEAHKLGLKTVVHIGSWTDARNAILAGTNSVTHLYSDGIIPDDLPNLYVRRGVLSIPTLSVQCDFIHQYKNPAVLQNPLLEALTGEKLRASYLDHDHYNEKGQWAVEWQTDDCLAHDFVSMKKLMAAGVSFGTGTDAGNLGVFEGYSVHREMALMVEAGMDTWQALAAATTVPGKFLNRSFGVEEGDVANLVVLAADPVANIENTQKISHVILHGNLVF